MDGIVEDLLKERKRLLLMRGRGGDGEHALRAFEYARYLLKHEDGDEEIVIPALYLHDIGRSRVDFDDFSEASPEKKRETQSLFMHIKYGAELAGRYWGVWDGSRRSVKKN